MIQRSLTNDLLECLGYSPAVAVLGSRQVGKTTLVKQLVQNITKESIYLDLEYFADVNKLKTAPDLFFFEHEDKVVILDEIQRMPELFPLLRSMIDQNRKPGRFIILGSASPDLLRQSSESLAGRIVYFELQPLHYFEVVPELTYQNHWLKGGFPDAVLAVNDRATAFWFRGFVQTYVERDLPNLGLNASPFLMRNMIQMLTNLHGGVLNYTTLSDSLGISQPTVKTYVNFLESAFLIRRLKPYFTNVGKRLIKSSKIYFRDTGILHYLLGLNDFDSLQGHPIIGNSWEGYVVQQIIANLTEGVEVYYYRTISKAEVDLVLIKNTEVRVAIEIKYGNSPSVSRGNILAFGDLKAGANLIVTPSADDYWYRKDIRVCSLATVWTYLENEGLLSEFAQAQLSRSIK